MKRYITLLLILCSFSLAACSGKETAETIEIQEMVDFEVERPDALQVIMDAEEIKVIEKVFSKARELGDFEDNTIPPQYTVTIGENEYYLWIDHTETGTIADVENPSFFSNIKTTDEFREIIGFE